jgi:hypothetical protein
VIIRYLEKKLVSQTDNKHLMNKYCIALVLYAIWFIKPTPISPVTLKVINRSGMEIALQLDGAVLGESYYFKVPKGDKQQEIEVSYSVQGMTIIFNYIF